MMDDGRCLNLVHIIVVHKFVDIFFFTRKELIPTDIGG